MGDWMCIRMYVNDGIYRQFSTEFWGVLEADYTLRGWLGACVVDRIQFSIITLRF